MDARKLQDLRNYGIHGAEAADEIDRLTRELAERETQLASIRQLLEDAEARAGSAAASLPDGWVAVPVEPTSEMVKAMAGECMFDEGQKWLDENAHKEYRAMLSARPESSPCGLPKGALYNLPTVDDLAQAIRQIDGNNSLGAGVLAEKIIEHFAE